MKLPSSFFLLPLILQTGGKSMKFLSRHLKIQHNYIVVRNGNMCYFLLNHNRTAMKQRIFLSFLCFVFISFRFTSVSAQSCMNRGSFRPNSTYDANLRFILSSLPTNVSSQDDFYYYGSIGQEPNRVYAMGMCIPGSIPTDCSYCIKKASDEFAMNCHNQTQAFSWPGDPTLCFVRYSNTSFSVFSELSPRVLAWNTGDINYSNLTEFTEIWEGLMSRMIGEASTAKSTPSSSGNYYKADVAMLGTIQRIYALMQCTPDISSSDCEYCLRQSAISYQSCCSEKQGGVVVQPSCFFRWDLYQFSKAFDNIKVASPPPPMIVPPPARDWDNTTDSDSKGISAGIVVAITVPTVVIVLILLVLGFLRCRRTNTSQKTEIQSDKDVSTTQSLQYEFKTIEAATNRFSRSNKLGEGGFGEVYKGMLSNGTEVAVKWLSKVSGQDTRKFRKEAVLASKLQHTNLVRLLGFCLQGEESFLIYEFVSNKSLDKFLFDTENQGQLDWSSRYKIIGGIAQGILHLHQHSQPSIIYRDFKASNILLDADMNPKISDFGMATVFGMEEARGNTNWIAETFVYMSPEYAMHGKFSMKSDVYSFGVLVLEIISGKKNSDHYQMDESTIAGNLVTYAWRLWRNGMQLELVDTATGRNYEKNEVNRCIHIALLCVQENPEDRPTLSTIIMMLTSNTITLPAPRLPGFFPTKQTQTGPDI